MKGINYVIMKKVKPLFFLLTLCMILFSCTEKSSVKAVRESGILRKNNMSEVQKKGKDGIKGMSVKDSKIENRPYKILIPFDYRQCKVDTLIDDTWVELYRKGHKYYLSKAEYTIGKEWDEIIGDSVSTLTSKRDVILYVNHLPSKMGEVNSVDLHIAPNSFLDAFYLKPGTTLRFTFEGKHYELKTKEKVFTKHGNQSYEGVILLNGKQIVRRTNLDKVDYSLMFAGDIDGDGKLDLVFNLSGVFGEVHVALYLSSCALPGQLVRKVAEVVDDFGC